MTAGLASGRFVSFTRFTPCDERGRLGERALYNGALQLPFAFL